jgi:hypothetical protein
MEASKLTALSLLLLAAIKGNNGMGIYFILLHFWGVSMDEGTVKTPIP